MAFFKHLRVVLKHKHYVYKYARKLGIPFIGFFHDMSKFSYTEFHLSSKYFSGKRSPTTIERMDNDNWSNICVHHVGRNKHHWHYWVDYLKDGIIVREIPFKHAVEYACDIMSASRVYAPKEFSYMVVYDYFKRHSQRYLMHPQSKEFILWIVDSVDKIGFKETRKLLKTKYQELHDKYGSVTILLPFKEMNLSYLNIKEEKEVNNNEN